MLVLTRRANERIRVRAPSGEDIWIEVARLVDGRKVRLGIVAPPGYEILREELIEPAGAPQTPHA